MFSGGDAISEGRSTFGGTGKLSVLSHSIYKSLSNVSMSAPECLTSTKIFFAMIEE